MMAPPQSVEDARKAAGRCMWGSWTGSMLGTSCSSALPCPVQLPSLFWGDGLEFLWFSSSASPDISTVVLKASGEKNRLVLRRCRLTPLGQLDGDHNGQLTWSNRGVTPFHSLMNVCQTSAFTLFDLTALMFFFLILGHPWVVQQASALISELLACLWNWPDRSRSTGGRARAGRRPPMSENGDYESVSDTSAVAWREFGCRSGFCRDEAK